MVMGDISEQVELVVVGGGPGGYAAAFHAADLGKKVALVEQESRLGGVCLLRGCIPSKAMITAGELLQRIRRADRMGLMVKGVEVDMKKLGAWRDGVINDLAGGIEALCKPRGIRRLVGRAVFRNQNELLVSGQEESTVLKFEQCIIAVGSRPMAPPPFSIGGNIMTSDAALALTEVPPTMLVVGGGYIGIELGTCYAALGSKVTIVEMLDRLLMGIEADLVRPVQKHLKEMGVEIHLESKVVETAARKDRVAVTVQPKEGAVWSKEFHKVLVAIGRKPNTDEIGLDRAGVQMDERGHVRVDAECRTSVKHIFAIGDCTGNPYLAHRARRMGIVAAEVAAGKKAAFDNRTIPAVVFSDPEIAYCGMSEEEAKQAGYQNVKVGRFRFAASGRAKTLDMTEGLVIVVADGDSEAILGVRMVGPNVSELIGEATLAVETGAVLEDLIATVHVHPTLSETLMEAAEGVRGHAVHMFRPHSETKTPAAAKVRAG